MMAMLEAGGIPPLTDDHRPADESNRNGYYEFEPVLGSRESVDWVPQAEGKSVKVIYALLDSLPAEFEYSVIFMMRDVREVVESQKRMLERLGRTGAASDTDTLEGIFTRERERTLRWLAEQTNFRTLQLDYGEIVADPSGGSQLIAEFLSIPLDTGAMARVASPEMRTVSHS